MLFTITTTDLLLTLLFIYEFLAQLQYSIIILYCYSLLLLPIDPLLTLLFIYEFRVFDSGKYFLTNHIKDIMKLIDLFIYYLIIIPSNIIMLPAGKQKRTGTKEQTTTIQ